MYMLKKNPITPPKLLKEKELLRLTTREECYVYIKCFSTILLI